MSLLRSMQAPSRCAGSFCRPSRSTSSNTYHRLLSCGNLIHRGYATEAEENDTSDRVSSNKWKGTINMPRTAFPLKADAIKREPLFRSRTTSELYRWQAEQKDRPLFVLHDGPPYANGELHLGHALNKILKDTLNRYQLLIGKRVHYHPGWDCHGLPIENKIYGMKRMSGRSVTNANPLLVRSLAREVAETEMGRQLDSFKTYGVMADWRPESTYRTYDTDYSVRQLRILREMVRKGLIYRAERPVYWSHSSRSALAESEIEYDENHISRSVYVRFPITVGKTLASLIEKNAEPMRTKLQEATCGRRKINAVIWTTTPWTLPANMAMCVNPELSYSIVLVEEGRCKGNVLIMATGLVKRREELKIGLNSTNASQRPLLGPLQTLLEFKGEDLLDSTYRHPYLPKEDGDRPIIGAPYVSADSGSGLVHSAPGHGHEDYVTWTDYCKTNKKAAEESILSPVNERCSFTDDVRCLSNLRRSDITLAGLPIVSEGTSKVIEQLYNSDDLLTEIRIQHKTPIDWRKKTVVVVRCTAQWFADLTSLRTKALKALEKVTFRPETGRTKLESLLTKRGEWCISRQRKWGVPIPVVYDAKTDEPLLNVENMEHIESVLQREGLDYWWKGEAEEFVKPSLRRDGVTWRKGEDIIDVWFDSGCSWNVLPDSDAVLDDGAGSGVRQPLADVYFEGTDQHRGWFQSSLLTYIALNGSDENPSAPFKQVLTHGFTLDKKKQKLSKSLGNYKSPDFFISGGAKKNDVAYGTDAVRFWTARGDPTKDIIVSSLVIKHASEAQRKIRTTCRFLLSQLGLPQNNPSLQGQKLGIVERYMLNELYKLEKTCRAAYEAYDPPTIAAGLLNFCSLTVSTQYIPFTKDALYADAIESPRRQAIVAVYDQTLRTLLSIMAPIMPHLAEEIFHYYGGATKDPEMAATMNEDSEVPSPSLFVHGWQSVAEEYKDEAAEREFEVILKIRRSAFATLEQGRQLRKMKESREADIHILTSGVDEKDRDVLEILMSNRDDLPEILSLAHVKFVEVLPDVNEKDDEGIDGKAHWSLDGQMDGIRYRLQPSTQPRCPRCWNYRKEEHKEICGRCEEAMRSV